MGNRVGYRIRDGDQVSDLIRKQCQTDDIKRVVTDVAKTLVTGSDGEGAIGAGGVALRYDLFIGRLSAALYQAVYSPPFDSIEDDPTTCDILDNGLYEIELIGWDHWKVWNYPINWKISTLERVEIFDKILIADVRFTEGESLANGMRYL